VSTLAVVIVVLIALIVLLVIGGLIASGRRRNADEAALRAEVQAANELLAQAHAQDNGWDRAALERAAGEAFARRSHAEVRQLHLIQVIDRPGTEDDQAVFRVVTDHGAEYVHLHRRGEDWVGEDVT